MRNAIVTMPDQGSQGQHRQVLRAAIRQLEHAEDYLVAISSLDIADAEVWRSIGLLRTEVDRLRRRLAQLRAAPTR